MADNSWLSWVQALVGLASLIVAFAVAVMTWLIVKETRAMVEQSRAQREPELIGRVEPFHVQYAQFVVTNVGAGAARDVFLQLEVGSLKSTWSHAVFEPGRTERFFLPSAPGADATADLFTTLSKARSCLVAVLKYTNASGQRVEAVIPEVNFAELVQRWESARWTLPESEVFEIGQRIQDKLNAIAKAIAQGFKSKSTTVGTDE
jgi:hypothetical protein